MIWLSVLAGREFLNPPSGRVMTHVTAHAAHTAAHATVHIAARSAARTAANTAAWTATRARPVVELGRLGRDERAKKVLNPSYARCQT